MNKNKSLPFVIGTITIFIALIVVFIQQSQKKDEYSTQKSNTESTSSTENAAGTQYTVSQVSKHNKKSDCWTSINEGVYNVTPWISQHPGGAEAILSLCGIDGSTAFNAQHSGQAQPESELASFKVGTLKK
jgi:cytochrome b involved in lipid metabolism